MEYVVLGWLLAGFVLGASAAWLFNRPSRVRVRQLEVELAQARQQAASDNATLAELRTRLQERANAAEEKLQLLNNAHQQLSDAFKALSAEALNTNNRAFLELANSTLARYQETAKTELDGKRQAIDETLKPLKESLEKVDHKIHQLEVERRSAYDLLTDQVKSLATSQSQLHTETANLVKALRAPATRGRWGELQLRRVVEMAGMVNRCDFHEQQTLYGEEGRLRPDMVVRLPNQRSIVVDSKTPLSAYLDALEAPDEATRVARLRDHAVQVRTHLKNLSEKNYWAQFSPAPEFVVAFLPGETFFSAALEHDPGLIEYGTDQRVILATPTTLIALLKAVAYGWRQEQLTVNAQEISALGGEIYSRLRILGDHFSRVGSSLKKALSAYNDAAGTLENRVLVTARRIKEKGATADDEIPILEPVELAPRSIQAPELLGVLRSSSEM